MLGNNIKNARKEKEISLKELSEKTGIREQYLLKIENGTAFGITITKFFIIANALDVEPRILTKGF